MPKLRRTIMVVLATLTIGASAACLPPQPAKPWPWERTSISACRLYVPAWNHDPGGRIFRAFILTTHAYIAIKRDRHGLYDEWRYPNPYSFAFAAQRSSSRGTTIWNHLKCI